MAEGRERVLVVTGGFCAAAGLDVFKGWVLDVPHWVAQAWESAGHVQRIDGRRSVPSLFVVDFQGADIRILSRGEPLTDGTEAAAGEPGANAEGEKPAGDAEAGAPGGTEHPEAGAAQTVSTQDPVVRNRAPRRR